MDWGCRLLGLDDGFLTAGGIGGGIIMVSNPYTMYLGRRSAH